MLDVNLDELASGIMTRYRHLRFNNNLIQKYQKLNTMIKQYQKKKLLLDQLLKNWIMAVAGDNTRAQH